MSKKSKVREAYNLQEQIKQLRAELKEKEERFKMLCESIIESKEEDSKYKLIVKEIRIRSIPSTYNEEFIKRTQAWAALSVSITKCDTLGLTSRVMDLIEVSFRKQYIVVQEN